MVRLKKFQILSDENEDTQKAYGEFLVRPTGYLSLCLNFEKVKLMSIELSILNATTTVMLLYVIPVFNSSRK